MKLKEELIPILKKLRLSGMLETLDLRVNQAVEDKLSFQEFLYRMLHDEVERRETKQLHKRLRKASFEQHKTLETFDFRFNPKIPKEKLIDLGTCQFVKRRQNVALIGPSGVGKSHLSQALGQRACLAGHEVLNLSAHKMLTSLRAARADGSYDRKLQHLCQVDLLLIDDLGLRPLQYDEPVDLYEVFHQRYEKGSMIITSNRTIDEWYPLFRDPLLASAALDRYLHHSHVIAMEGFSFRNPPKRKETLEGTPEEQTRTDSLV